jgi:RNA polymerase sigma factor (sigma-70 family)
LLAAFVRDKDEAAFESLVRRHGPMVLGVARRLVGNEHDAADVFQAVFLVLARKAASIRAPEVLGAWLYNVAYRTSVKARGVLLKRKAREGQVSVMPEPAVQDSPVDDVLEVLDEELRSLPAKYQAPVVLCELQGETRKAAAAKLNLPEGTVSSRLALARKKLAERLRKRGVVVSAAGLSAILAQNTAAASVPAPLVLAAVKAAVPAAAGQVAATLVSAKVLALSDGVIKSMLLAKLKIALLMILVPCILGGAFQGAAMLMTAQPDEEAQALATLKKLGARLRWQVTPAGKQLVGVDLRRTQVQDEHLKVLQVFKELRDVSVMETAITDRGCQEFAALAKLQALRLNHTAIADEGLKSLAGLTQLTTLNAGWTKLTGASLKDLAGLTELRDLDLRYTGVTDGDLPSLAPFQNLRQLELGHTRVTDAGLKRLAALPRLQMLRLESLSLTDAGLKDLASLPQAVPLTFLSLEDNPGVTDDGLPHLAPLAKLGGLNLSGTKVTDAGVTELRRFTDLRWLALDRTAVTGATFDPAGFKLSTLWLSGSKISDATVKNVAALSSLGTLWLDKTALTDAGVKELAALRRLNNLSLQDTAVTDTALATVAGLEELRQLNLSGTKVTDTGLKGLTGMRRLRWLALHNTAVTDVGVKHLTELKDLETLWLSWTKVTQAGLKDVARLKDLSTLRLGGLPVTDAGLKDVAGMKKLHTLWLDWTQVSDAGLKELAGLDRLQELRLEGTQVSDAGLKELAAFKQLQRVELPRTNVTPAAVRELQTALPGAAVNIPAAGDSAPPPAGQGKTMSWLLAGLGVAAGGSLLAWLLLSNRKRALVPALVCAALAGLVLIGVHVFHDGSAAQPPAEDQAQPKLRLLRGHTGPVHGVAFTHDGRRLISASGWPGRDNSIRFWDLDTGQELHKIPAFGQASMVRLSADGRFALVGSLGALFYLDVEKGEPIKVLRPLNAPTGAVCFSADGEHAFTGSQDGVARRWHLAQGREVNRYRVAGKWCRFVGELPGGQLVTVDNTGLVQFWDVAKAEEIRRFETGVAWTSAMTLSPDGKHAILGGWDAVVFDLETGRKVRTLHGHQNELTEISFSPDGTKVLTCSMDGTVRLWDYQTGQPLGTLLSQDEFVFGAAFSKDGRYVASGGGGRKEGKEFAGGTDHDIRVLELPAPEQIAAAATPTVNPRLLWAGLLGTAVVVALGGLMLVRRRRAVAAAPPLPVAADAGAAVIAFACAGCGKNLKAKTAVVGKKVKCPQCGAATVVPGAS